MDAPGQDTPRGDGGIALVLAGGIGLGAFEAGAYAALHEAGLSDRLRWVAGSSIGAATAAILAGNAPEHRLSRLHGFWRATASSTPFLSTWFGAGSTGPWREAANQFSAAHTLAFGRPGLFQPRMLPWPRSGASDVPALYDLAPLEAHLPRLLDFGLLNHGPVRVSVAATDVVTGDRVVFDTGRGCVLTPRHILASCALLPLFAPIELDGRLLADGSLSSNAPLDLVLDDPAGRALRCFVIDLFAAEGQRPHTLAAGASRAGDLAFANQTRRLLEAQAREDRLRQGIATLAALLPPEQRAGSAVAAILAEGRPAAADVTYLSYRAGLDEAGLAKSFDFSPATLADRWNMGEGQMRSALAL